MDLQPGCPLVVAPHFYLTVDWPDRLLLGSVAEEDGRFFPRLSWRPATAAEQSLLVGDPTRLTKDEALARGVCLFALPQHLQTAFATLLEQVQEATSAPLEGFDRFAREVARFLDFKGLSVSEGAIFDLVVSKPGQRSIRWDAEAQRGIGLTCNLASWGGINLGDEAVSLLYVNLTARQLEALDESAPAAIGELARRFLRRCPDYPLVRLRLEPGEGYRAPEEGMLMDACTLDLQGPSLMLLIRQPLDTCG